VRIEAVEHVPGLLTTLRETRLRGFDGARPYASASLSIEALDPDDVVPAQNYVLEPGLRTVLALRTALLAWDVDVFALSGAVHVRTPDETIPVLPPIVEESIEPDGRTVLLVNDGMHRVFAARRLGCPIACVVVRGVPPEYPYYAYALPGGWASVTPVEELPDGHQKKDYRRPSSYKDLFREFNAMFPGVQAQRRQTNPAHLRR
jgi:hypothetical protein